MFKSVAYVHVEGDKLEPRNVKCMFIGYSIGMKWFKLWDFTKSKCIISKDAMFREIEMFISETKDESGGTTSNRKTVVEVELHGRDIDEDGEIRETITPNEVEEYDVQYENREIISTGSSEHLIDYSLARDKIRREIRAPNMLGYLDLIA